jgi:hypothetical protein
MIKSYFNEENAMSARWSLSNSIQGISFQQFKDLGTEFKTAAEKAFSTECDVEAKFMARPKLTNNFFDETAMDRLNAINEQNTFTKTSDLNSIVEQHWNDAAYIEISIRPREKDKAPASSWAHLEFKGRYPKAATYYIQGPENEICQGTAAEISGQHKFMRQGDGYESHGHRSADALLSIADRRTAVTILAQDSMSSNPAYKFEPKTY